MRTYDHSGKVACIVCLVFPMMVEAAMIGPWFEGNLPHVTVSSVLKATTLSPEKIRDMLSLSRMFTACRVRTRQHFR